MQGRYIIVKKIKSGTKISETSKLYVQDIIFVLFMVLGSFILSDYVLDQLFFPFLFFNIAVGLYLVMPARYNPGHKNYKSIYLYFISDSSVFRPLVNISQKNKTKKMKESIEKNE